MMEAARILQAIGAKPRRTIRVALWGGEEEGLLGSHAYVDEHFGTAETAEDRSSRSSTRTGTSTPAPAACAAPAIFGPPEARDDPRAVPQAVRGPRRLRRVGDDQPRTTGGTDSTSFNHAGLPGIGGGQDSDRIQQPHAPHEPRHLRAHPAGRREEGRDHHGGGRLPHRDARRDDAAVREGPDAAAAGRARGRRGARIGKDQLRTQKPELRTAEDHA